MTLSHLKLQWGEPCSEATFGTGTCVVRSSVSVAGPAASSGQPLVLTVYSVANPDLAPACQVAEEGRVGVASLLVMSR